MSSSSLKNPWSKFLSKTKTKSKNELNNHFIIYIYIYSEKSYISHIHHINRNKLNIFPSKTHLHLTQMTKNHINKNPFIIFFSHALSHQPNRSTKYILKRKGRGKEWYHQKRNEVHNGLVASGLGMKLNGALHHGVLSHQNDRVTSETRPYLLKLVGTDIVSVDNQNLGVLAEQSA